MHPEQRRYWDSTRRTHTTDGRRAVSGVGGWTTEGLTDERDHDDSPLRLRDDPTGEKPGGGTCDTSPTLRLVLIPPSPVTFFVAGARSVVVIRHPRRIIILSPDRKSRLYCIVETRPSQFTVSFEQDTKTSLVLFLIRPFTLIMPADPKIIDIISKEKEGPYVSLEYFPPRSAEGVKVRSC